MIYKKFFVDGAPPNTGGTNYHAGGLYPNSIPQTLTAIYFNASVPAPPKNFTVAPTSPPPPIIANPGPTPTNSCQSRPVGGNPINFTIGDKFQTETDYVGSSGLPAAWQLSTAAEEVETYDVQGKLVSIALRTGSLITFDYSVAATPVTVAPAPGLLIRVTDPFGRQLNLTYDSSSRVKQMTDPEGNAFAYSYDANENLVAVIYPDITPSDPLDNPKRIYQYNEQAYTSNTAQLHALTGIVDENNQRFATYNYDIQGRAISSEHAGGVEKVSITYNSNSSSTVVDALGTARTYGLQTIQDVSKVTSMTGRARPAAVPQPLR